MNTYIAFYKSKKVIIKADTAYEAQQRAIKIFSAKRENEVIIMKQNSNDKEAV